MLVGVGGLGGVILELLAREGWIGQIVAADRDAERGAARCNLARVSAVAQGYCPTIKFRPLDLSDHAAVVKAITETSPDLILSTASMLTWWLPDTLPQAQARRIKSARFGVWLPVHLTLSMKLMLAVRAADYQGHVLTAPFPDVVNCVLGKLDLAPTCGVGNLDEVVAKIRLLAAQRLDTRPDEIRVTLVAHHALEPAAFGELVDELPPYFVRIEHAGQEVTAEVDGEELLFASYPLPVGPETHFLTAGSTIRLIQALFSETETYLHVPAPGGLPGGYPVFASREGIRLALIEGLAPERAIEINERSHRFDGVHHIEDDGTVEFCGDSVAILRQEFGYDCKRLAPAEAEARAGELIMRFKDYARKHGADIH